MVNEWIDPIYSRTYADVQSVMYNVDQNDPKGCYNLIDPNRVENNTAYVLEYMLEHKIIRAAPTMRIKTDWKEDEIIVASEMKRIVENVAVLCSLSNPIIRDSLPGLHLATQMNYILANDIERALDIMHDQPELPINQFELKLNDGLILTIDRLDGTTDTINSSAAMLAEDEIAHITAVAPEPDAAFKAFARWSGNTDDLQYLDNVEDSTTTYTGQYHDVEFSANFKSAYPRTLTLTNAYISLSGDDKAEDGPRTGVYHAGDNVMIIADVAPMGKAFYCWEGTPEALAAISVADLDPSTVWLAMPDCDVQLYPRYVNAGQHYVSVTNGTGSGYYNYDDTVSISANVPTNYGFDNWSGDTQYLSDIHSASISFKMPDVNISFRANYSYRYSYYNVQIINGLIRGETTVQNVRESSSLPLTPTPPDDSQGIDYWSIEGAGSVSGNTFYVGKGNAIITGHYGPYRTLTVHNLDNAGGTNTYRAVQGHNFASITTAYSVGNYYFRRWEENGASISTNRTITLPATSDRDITAVYEYVEPTPPPPTYDLTIINQNNTGETTVIEGIREGVTKNISSNTTTADSILIGYYKDGQYTESESGSVNVYMNKNITIEFVYRAREYRTVYVDNGYITGTGASSAQVLERTSVGITANAPGARQGFYTWGVVSGTPYSSPGSSISSSVTPGLTDVTVAPEYKNKVYVTITTYSGSTTYDLMEGQSVPANAIPSPDLYEINKWGLNSGDARIANPYSSSTTVTAQQQDSVVEMDYKPIPWYRITVINGYVQIDNQWVETGEVMRGSAPQIKMKPAPEGHQFLQWEIISGSQSDVYQQFAETTTLRNVTHDITVRATYYIPNPEVKYTLTITQKDGTIETYNAAVGEQINIYAQYPDEGYRFYRWAGDYQYLVGGRYMSDNVVNMPEKNIELQPTYVREGYVTKYHLYMYSAECLISTTEDPETHEVHEIWGTDGEFEEGTQVQIRAINIPFGWKFDSWEGESVEQTALVRDRYDPETVIVMGDIDVHMSATVIEEYKYTMKINNGQTSGEYYGDARVDVYFDKINTDTEHYAFTRWTGDVQYLDLFDGGVFDVTKPGTSNDPQYIKMPLRRIEITGEYTAAYRLKINGGHIEGTQEEFFASGTVVNIVADVEEGMIFQRWEGNTDGIGSIYDPTTTITMGDGAKEITAVYTNNSDRNAIGYGLISFVTSDIINASDITVITGELSVGFILTDSIGHFYLVTSVTESVIGITRLTKISKGGDIYE